MPAVAIPAIIGAAGVGVSAYGANKAAGASKDAARTQAQAADKAQAFNQRAYDDTRAALSPYQQAGQFALSNLMARQYGGNFNAYSPPKNYGPEWVAQQQQSMFRAPTPGGHLPMPNMSPQSMPTLSNPMGRGPMPGPPQGAGVWMVGPDGSRQQVPPGNVQMALAHGAKLAE